MKNEIRTITLTHAKRDNAARTIKLSLSSETPVPRYDGNEVLVHSPGAVDLSRAPLPLCIGHDLGGLPVGVVENLQLSGGKLRGVARFGTSPAATEAWQSICDGITRNISIGYSINETQNDGDTILVTKWTPYEASLVAVPADNTVGVNRSKLTGDSKMESLNIEATEEQVVTSPTMAERNRIREISTMGNRFGYQEIADQAIEQGWKVDRVRRVMAARQIEDAPATPHRGEFHLQNRQQFQDADYSLTRALHAQSTGDWTHAGLEREVSQELVRQRGRKSEGLVIPWSALGSNQRDLNTGGFTEGGALVAQQYMAGDFIDLLRKKCRVMALGATQLTGLVGNVVIPKLSSASSASWLQEGAEIPASQPDFGQVKLSPKTLAARVILSRRLLLQGAPGAEMLVRNDLANIIGVELDRVAINGSGIGQEPTGIINSANIGSVVGGTNGAALTWQQCVDLIAAVESNNAENASSAFLVNAKTKSKLLATSKAANTAEMVWEYLDNGEGRIAGYRAVSSNNVPGGLTKGTAAGTCSALIFGSFSELIIGMWGPGIEVLTNPYSHFATGDVEVRVMLDCDIANRHPEAFAVMKDAITG